MIDLDEGVSTPAPEPVVDASEVVVAAGEVLVADEGAVVPLGGRRAVFAVDRGLRLVPASNCGCAWVLGDDRTGLGGGSLWRIDGEGRQLDGPVDLPDGARPIAASGSDVLVDDSGRLVRLTPLGPVELGVTGTPLALAGRRILTVICRNLGDCDLRVVDFDSGVVNAANAPVGLQLLRDQVGFPPSPDGTTVLVPAANGARDQVLLLLFDLESGAGRVIPRDGRDPIRPDAVAWTREGNWVVFADGGALWALDRQAGRILDMGVDTDVDTRLVTLPPR